jgi:carbonic anhydrase
MTAIDEFLIANRHYASQFEPIPAGTPRVALVMCMDARIDPVRVLGIPPGHAHLIRNAGGRVVDAVRSLIISQQMLGTEEVAIVHHTECGMQALTDRELRARLRERFDAAADHLAFLGFSDLAESVRDDLALYRRTPFLRQDIPVRGFIYNVATGRLEEVDDDAPGTPATAAV